MRTKSIMIAFLIALSLVMAMPAMAFGTDYENTDAECSFDGSRMTSNFNAEDLATSISDLEPGDTLHYEVTYTNKSDKTTNWYMRNEVIETLEDNKDLAENGGYTYVLKNIGPDGTETVYFDNSSVGGDDKTGALEGLKEATNATRDYFFIQKLAPTKSGVTSLDIALDGETQVNDYMDTKGIVRIAYAVEVETPGQGGDLISNTKTGDPFDMIRGLVIMILALIMGLVAYLSWRKDRKGGGAA